MTLLPFEDLPDKTDSELLFDEWWPKFWEGWPNKVDKQEAVREFRKALRITTPTEIIQGRDRYIAAKPDWREWMGPAKFLRRRRWEDEYDAPVKGSRSGLIPLENLKVIAAHVKKPYCRRGEYTRERLEQCRAAGFLTAEEVEDKT